MVAGQHAGAVRRAVAQPDANDADVLDHVLVGDEIAARIDQDAGAHAVDAVLRGSVGKEFLGGRSADRALAVDIDHGGAHALDDLDDGGTSWIGRCGQDPGREEGDGRC